MTAPIPLAEQIAAVERALQTAERFFMRKQERDRLAAALATLRGLLKHEQAPDISSELLDRTYGDGTPGSGLRWLRAMVRGTEKTR